MRGASVLLICVATLALGCHRDQQQAATPKAAAQKKAQAAPAPGPSVEQQTAGMVEAATSSKSTVPIQLKFELSQRPVVGEPLTVNLALIPDGDANSASMLLAEGSGLTVASGGGEVLIPEITPHTIYRHDIQVTPPSEGVFFLSLTVTLKYDDSSESRVFTVPIIVDPAKSLAANAAK